MVTVESGCPDWALFILGVPYRCVLHHSSRVSLRISWTLPFGCWPIYQKFSRRPISAKIRDSYHSLPIEDRIKFKILLRVGVTGLFCSIPRTHTNVVCVGFQPSRKFDCPWTSSDPSLKEVNLRTIELSYVGPSLLKQSSCEQWASELCSSYLFELICICTCIDPSCSQLIGGVRKMLFIKHHLHTYMHITYIRAHCFVYQHLGTPQ